MLSIILGQALGSTSKNSFLAEQSAKALTPHLPVSETIAILHFFVYGQ